MHPLITELGVGGVLAIVIVREVLNFVSRRNGKNNRPNHSPERCIGVSRTEFDVHKTEVQYRGTCEQITKRLEDALKFQEKTVIQSNNFQQRQFQAMDKQLGEIKEMIGKITK